MPKNNTKANIIKTSAGEVEYIQQGNGKPILFVHGSPGGCDQGALMAEFLVSNKFKVISLSRPGYVNTPLNDCNKSPDKQAELHIALMDKLGIDRFSVMCWSGGGPSSYLLAAKYPKRVTALVCIAAVSKAYKFRGGIENSLAYSKLGGWLLAEMAKHSPKNLIKSTISEEGDLSKAQVKELAEQVWKDPKKREFVIELSATLAGRKAGLNNDHAEFSKITNLELDKITAPTMLVHGTADSDVSPEYSDYARKKISASTLVNIKDGTHIAVWTDSKSNVVQKKIIEFIK